LYDTSTVRKGESLYKSKSPALNSEKDLKVFQDLGEYLPMVLKKKENKLKKENNDYLSSNAGSKHVL
jgi:hypothetical protein